MTTSVQAASIDVRIKYKWAPARAHAGQQNGIGDVLDRLSPALWQDYISESPERFLESCARASGLLQEAHAAWEPGARMGGPMLTHRGCYGPLGLIYGRPLWVIALQKGTYVQRSLQASSMSHVLRALRMLLCDGAMRKSMCEGMGMESRWQDALYALESNGAGLLARCGAAELARLVHHMLRKSILKHQLSVHSVRYGVHERLQDGMSPQMIEYAVRAYACAPIDIGWGEEDLVEFNRSSRTDDPEWAAQHAEALDLLDDLTISHGVDAERVAALLYSNALFTPEVF